jgi:hypothetical protein
MPAEGMMANGTAYRRSPQAAYPLVTADDQKCRRRRWHPLEPTNRKPRLVQGLVEAASVFGGLLGETHLGQRSSAAL